MSIAAVLERNLRDRVRRNLDAARPVLVQIIQASIPEKAAAATGTSGEVTGQLAAGIVCDNWSQSGDRYTTVVRSLAHYSSAVEFGTGIYGPSGSPIVPTASPYLVFYWHKAGHWVRTKSVRGFPGFNFFFGPMADNLESALDTVWGP